MPRTWSRELDYDSSHFTSRQLSSTAAVRLAFSGWAGWTAAHVVPFPLMIRDHACGFAVMGVRLEYHAPYTFLDGSRLTPTTTARLLGGLSLMETVTSISAGGCTIAEVALLCRALTVDTARGMTAAPGVVPGSVADRYLPEETDTAGTFTDRLSPLLDRLDQSALTGKRASTVLIDQRLCEAADQWCFAEIPQILSSSREHLIHEQADAHPRLRQGILRPLAAVEYRLRRPLFLYDQATVHTSAYLSDAGAMVFVHTISDAHGRLCGQAVETLGPRP